MGQDLLEMLKNALSLFVVTVIILAVFLPSYATMQDLKRKNREYAQKIAELEAKNQSYQFKLADGTDEWYVAFVKPVRIRLGTNGEVS